MVTGVLSLKTPGWCEQGVSVCVYGRGTGAGAGVRRGISASLGGLQCFQTLNRDTSICLRTAQGIHTRQHFTCGQQRNKQTYLRWSQKALLLDSTVN